MATRDLPFFGRINDSHTHVWLGQRLKNRSPRVSPIDSIGEVETLLERMDQQGVRRSAIITPTTLGFDNSLTLELAKIYRDRLVPIVRIDPFAGDSEDQVARLIELGAKGLRLSINNSIDGSPIGEPMLSSLWQILTDQRIPLLIHCNYDQLPLVKELSEKNPNLLILLDHMARVTPEINVKGETFFNLLALAEAKNTYVKISSTNFFSTDPLKHSDLIPYIERILEEYGEHRLLWGSDWPFSETNAEYRDSFEPLLTMRESIGNRSLECIFVDNFEKIFQTDQVKHQ